MSSREISENSIHTQTDLLSQQQHKMLTMYGSHGEVHGTHILSMENTHLSCQKRHVYYFSRRYSEMPITCHKVIYATTQMNLTNKNQNSQLPSVMFVVLIKQLTPQQNQLCKKKTDEMLTHQCVYRKQNLQPYSFASLKKPLDSLCISFNGSKNQVTKSHNVLNTTQYNKFN